MSESPEFVNQEASRPGTGSQSTTGAVEGSEDAFAALLKAVWRPLSFTGVWVPLIPVILFLIEPEPQFIALTTFGLFFSIFWTVRNVVKSDRLAVSGRPRKRPRSQLNGVFFGIDENSGKSAGKPVENDGHILVVGGAGTGKSSAIAIPTLKYYWDATFLAVDIKGELAEKSGRKAHIFNPSSPQTIGYDPFYLARTLDNPVSHIRDIALTLVPEPPNMREPFWIKAAQNILTGHLLFSYGYGVTFIQALKKMMSVPPQRLVEVMAANEQAGMFVSQYVGIRSETLASIMSELSNHIIPFVGDPDIEKCLSKQEIITPNTLEQGNSIFLQMPEYKINQWKTLITLIIQQFLTHFERRSEGQNEPILFLIDEFARAGNPPEQEDNNWNYHPESCAA